VRTALRLAARFTAHAVSECLARRPEAAAADGVFSAERELAALVESLDADDEGPSGLDPNGAAARARLDLDELLLDEPGDPLARLERRLELSPTERDVLRVLLAWSVEPRVAALVGHVNESLQETTLRVRRLCEILGDAERVCLALSPGSALRRARLLAIERADPDSPVQLDARVLAFAVGGELPEAASDSGRAFGFAPLDGVPCPDRVTHFAGVDVLVLDGGPGAGRRAFAAAVAAREGRPLWVLAPSTDSPPAELVETALRDARLLDARLLYWGTLGDAAARVLASAVDVPLALGGPESPRVPAPLLARTTARAAIELPSVAQRGVLWASALGDSGKAEALARRFALTPGQIERAARQLATHSAEDACRLQLHHELDKLAVATEANVGWDRLVLPERSLSALHALCAQVRNREQVESDWGFGDYHALGRGLKALFHGRPGTGKSFVARVLAHELGLPIFCVDVSRILSRWIGVAEERVSELFAQARRAEAILFFDEADSLFAARTAVASTATERYSNTLVNHLLQLVDSHPGVVLLATNLKSAIEPALMRRLHYVIEFPEPDRSARERLWKVCLPPNAPLDPAVDFAELARRHELAGGAIRNAVTSAAYLAAESRRPIGPEHLARALVWEYDKLDRLAPASS
jgi:adenylate kinase family enzyme